MRSANLLPVTGIILINFILCGCGPRQDTTKNTVVAVETLAAPPSSPIRFSDVTQQAAIKFKHNSGAFGLKLMPETMGSGVAFIDFDGDGFQDLFFVNCRYWTPQEVKEYQGGKWSEDEMTVFKRTHPPGTKPQRFVPATVPQKRTTGELYKNNGDGTFRNVTKGSGLDIEMFGMGAAVGDYDNDGRPDLYVTGLGRNYLFHNEGNGRFREVASAKGVQDSGWSTSAAWLDYDKDGRLDLFVCHYVDWKPNNDRYGTMNGRDKSYTAPFFIGARSPAFITTTAMENLPTFLKKLALSQLCVLHRHRRVMLSKRCPPSHLAWQSAIITTTVGRTSQSPMTASPIASFAITKTARSPKAASKREWPTIALV